MRILLVSFYALISSVFCLSATAHDFWLAPENYTPEPEQDVEISIMIGHVSDNMLWPAMPHRVVAFRSIGPEGIQDHQAELQNMPIVLNMDEPGLYVLSIETNHAFSELDAEKFNAYVKAEGVTPIRLDRALKGTTAEAGTEIYSRRGKAIIQVGALGAKDPDYLRRPLGQTLEIIPDENPQRVKQGAPMSARIFYRGEPAKGVTVNLVDIQSDQGKVQQDTSNETGQVTFNRPDKGEWMLHAVWSAPIQNARADYETIFSSLSFSLDNATHK